MLSIRKKSSALTVRQLKDYIKPHHSNHLRILRRRRDESRVLDDFRKVLSARGSTHALKRLLSYVITHPKPGGNMRSKRAIFFHAKKLLSVQRIQSNAQLTGLSVDYLENISSDLWWISRIFFPHLFRFTSQNDGLILSCALTREGSYIVDGLVTSDLSDFILLDSRRNAFDLSRAYQSISISPEHNRLFQQYTGLKTIRRFSIVIKPIKPAHSITLACRYNGELLPLSEYTIDKNDRLSVVPHDNLSFIQYMMGSLGRVTMSRLSSIDLQIWNEIRTKSVHRDSVEVSTRPLQQSSILTSIIVPIYRRTDLIAHQIRSLEKIDNFAQCCEIIYVNDDPTVFDSLIQELAWLSSYHQVTYRLVQNASNYGYCASCNIGACYARGKYLVFMDSDVIPDSPEWIASLMNEFTNDESLGIAYPMLKFIDDSAHSAALPDSLDLAQYDFPSNYIEYVAELLADSSLANSANESCFMITKDLYSEVQGFDEQFLPGPLAHQDLALRVIHSGNRLKTVKALPMYHLAQSSLKLLYQDFRDELYAKAFNTVVFTQKHCA